MPRTLIALAVLVLTLGHAREPIAQTVAGVSPPQTISPLGHNLTLAGCGARDMLWMNLYAVALYLPQDLAQGNPGSQAIFGPDTAKAVRLYPVYEGELPSQIPGSWRERLQQKLSPDLMSLVQRFYDRLGTKDTATIAYASDQGTVLMVNDQVFARTDGNQLMRGILETWIGPTPEGDNPIKLLSGGC